MQLIVELVVIAYSMFCGGKITYIFSTHIRFPVIVIHGGTNNIDSDVCQPYDIQLSVISSGSRLREKQPIVKVVVAGILLREPNTSKRRSKIQQTITGPLNKCLYWMDGWSPAQ